MKRPVPGSTERHYDPAVNQLREALKLAKETGAAASVVEALEKASDLVTKRDNFALDGTSAASPACAHIEETTITENWEKFKAEGKTTWNLTPRMMTGHLEGQFLKSLISMQQAKRVLDVGMYTGYSALSMAEALPADGEVLTIDRDPFLKEYTGNLVNKSPHGKKIKILIGNALEVMTDLANKGEKFDIIFLDADKSEYPDYLRIAFDQGMLNPKGSILVDNAFRGGKGYMATEGTNSTLEFAAAVKARTNLHKCLVPLRDGVLILRRVSDVDGPAS